MNKVYSPPNCSKQTRDYETGKQSKTWENNCCIFKLRWKQKSTITIHLHFINKYWQSDFTCRAYHLHWYALNKSCLFHILLTLIFCTCYYYYYYYYYHHFSCCCL